MSFFASAKKAIGLASTADEIAILEKKLSEAVDAQILASKLKEKDIPELLSKIGEMDKELDEKKNTKTVNEQKITELKKEIIELEKQIVTSKKVVADVEEFFKKYNKLVEEKNKMEASLKKNTEISTPEIQSKLTKDIADKKAQKKVEDEAAAKKKLDDAAASKARYDAVTKAASEKYSDVKKSLSGVKMPSLPSLKMPSFS